MNSYPNPRRLSRDIQAGFIYLYEHANKIKCGKQQFVKAGFMYLYEQAHKINVDSKSSLKSVRNQMTALREDEH